MVHGALLGLLGAPTAAATEWAGGDLAGANLLTIAGDAVTGTFTNVGTFVVPVGATVTVTHGTPFEIHAERVLIDGTLEATGAGYDHGSGTVAGAFAGTAGQGLGGGQGGFPGPCAHGGGGGGGGYGGPGGDGGYWFEPIAPAGGFTYGDASDPGTADMGSGGGGSGSDCYSPSEDGGDGGGFVFLAADIVEINGDVIVDGAAGRDHVVTYSGGGGGGSGGAIVIDAEEVVGRGGLFARGGHGGDTVFLAGGYAGGGGGGGGGRIYVFSAIPSLFTPDASGGQNGTDMFPLPLPSQGGVFGTVRTQLTDPDVDGDGIVTGADNCPTDANPSQADDDGDDLGDPCDPCRGDPGNDEDFDGVCAADDACPTGPDDDDPDGDGVASACDPCPVDAPDDSDGDGSCDSEDLCPGVDDADDRDLDGVADACDLCPDAPDTDQRDVDEDGSGDACDCSPRDPLVGGGVPETCNGVDDDCDGETDEDAEDGFTFWVDADGDGQGVEGGATTEGCLPPPGFADNTLDCDDADPTVHAFATELCDGIDNDCDGALESGKGCAEDEGAGTGGCACDQGGGAAAFGLGAALLVGSAARRRRQRTTTTTGPRQASQASQTSPPRT